MAVDAGRRQTRFGIHRLHPNFTTGGCCSTTAHERLTDRPWDPAWARAAIAAVAADAEAAFDPDALWPAHPRDEEEGPLEAVTSPVPRRERGHLGADELARLGSSSLRRDMGRGRDRAARALPRASRRIGVAVPSLWMGEAGILLVAHRLAPVAPAGGAPARVRPGERRQPGARAHVGLARDDARRARDARAHRRRALGARRGGRRRTSLWDAWERRASGDAGPLRPLGRATSAPAHGFAGNVARARAAAGLLDDDAAAELERRAAATALASAQRDGDLAQWPPVARPPDAPSDEVRTQWCHGAPGMVTSLAALAPATTPSSTRCCRRRRADLACRAARQGRRPLPRHGRQRLRVPRAVRAHGRRALARARARLRDARRRAGRARARAPRPWPPHAVDRRPGHAVFLARCLGGDDYRGRRAR